MQLYPADLAQSLDFNFIRRELASFCSNPSTKEQALGLKPLSDRKALFTGIAESDQILALYLSEESFPSAEFPSLDAFLSKLSIRGHALREEQFADIRTTALNYRHLERFVSGKKERLAALWEKMQFIPSEKFVIEEIDRVLDERGVVRSNASPELNRIRRDLVKKRASADRIFNRVLKKWRDKGYVADFDESVSEDRRVLAIQASYKGQVQGILHGSSSRHSIAFIEPGETVEINNDIAELLEAEKEEIKRILRELSSILAPYREHLEQISQALIWLDFIRAKALFAQREEACYPQLGTDKKMVLKEAFNPVLRHFNREKDKTTVALNLELDSEQRILVISGPNAGGKSLSLKTVGLLQIMLQSGLAVPVHPESTFCLFEQLLGDIGDAQSIENELSTYSSKLQKMEHFLRYTDANTLLLIDEFGSGSDPELGSALAQVFLERLNAYGAYGIMTTHFNAIKALAAETPGVVNGAMLFERSTFNPRYELQIGQPGSSYTFEVAQRSGIPKHIIKDARSRVAQNTLEVDKLLVQIQQDKVAIEKVRSAQEAELQKLRKLEKAQEERIQKLEDKVKKHSKINEEQDRLMYWGQRFNKLIEAWMDQKTQKDKKAVVARFIAMLNQRSEEVQKEEGQSHQKEVKQHSQQLARLLKEEVKIGMQIRMIDSGIEGQLMEKRGDKYLVALGGNMTSLVEREKFVRADANLGRKPKRKKRKKSFTKSKEVQQSTKDTNEKGPSTKKEKSSKESGKARPRPKRSSEKSKSKKESPSKN